MKRVGFVFPAIVTACVAIGIAGCGGGGGGGNAAPGSVVSFVATPTPAPASQSTTITAGSAGTSATFAAISSGATGAISISSAASGSSAVNVTFSGTPPSGLPAVQSSARLATSIGGTALTTYAFFTFVSASTVQFATTPSFTLTLPGGLPAGLNYYAGIYDAAKGWTMLAGPAASNGTTVTISSIVSPTSFVAGGTVAYVVFSTSTALATPTPIATGANLPGATLATPGPAIGYMSLIGTNTFASAVATTSMSGLISNVSGQIIANVSATSPSLPSATIVTKAGTSATAFGLQPVTEGPMSGRTRSSLDFSLKKRAEVVESDARKADFAGLLQRATHGSAPAVARRAQSLPTTLNATSSFAVSTGTAGQTGSSTTQVPATLKAVSAHGYVWIDNTLTLDTTATTAIGADFDNAYASDVAHFGSPEWTGTSPGALLKITPCDTNGTAIPSSSPVPVFIPPPNGMHVVLVLNASTFGAGVGGYFAGTNLVTQSAANCLGGQPRSNEAAMIVVEYDPSNTSQFELQEDLVRGTAHELQHEINYVAHQIVGSGATSERNWINEGLSMLAQDLAVNAMFPNVPNDVDDALQRANDFFSSPSSFSLTGFTGIEPGTSTFAVNCSGCYGAAYLFQRYLYDRFGGDTYLRAMETSNLNGTANIQHATGAAPALLISDFAIALATSSTGFTADPRYNFTHFNPYGSFTDQFGRMGTLQGPGVFSLTAGASRSISAHVGTFHYLQLLLTKGVGAGLSVTDSTGTFALSSALVQF